MAVYTIVVKGELSELFSSSFDGVTLQAGDGETALTCDIVDQSQLQGVLSQVADLGLVLVSVTQTGSTDVGQAAVQAGPANHEQQGDA